MLPGLHLCQAQNGAPCCSEERSWDYPRPHEWSQKMFTMFRLVFRAIPGRGLFKVQGFFIILRQAYRACCSMLDPRPAHRTTVHEESCKLLSRSFQIFPVCMLLDSTLICLREETLRWAQTPPVLHGNKKRYGLVVLSKARKRMWWMNCTFQFAKAFQSCWQHGRARRMSSEAPPWTKQIYFKSKGMCWAFVPNALRKTMDQSCTKGKAKAQTKALQSELASMTQTTCPSGSQWYGQPEAHWKKNYRH